MHSLVKIPSIVVLSGPLVCCRTCDGVPNAQRPTWPTFDGCDGLKVLVDLLCRMYIKYGILGHCGHLSHDAPYE
jgi:hypothetical protein